MACLFFAVSPLFYPTAFDFLLPLISVWESHRQCSAPHGIIVPLGLSSSLSSYRRRRRRRVAKKICEIAMEKDTTRLFAMYAIGGIKYVIHSLLQSRNLSTTTSSRSKRGSTSTIRVSKRRRCSFLLIGRTMLENHFLQAQKEDKLVNRFVMVALKKEHNLVVDEMVHFAALCPVATANAVGVSGGSIQHRRAPLLSLLVRTLRACQTNIIKYEYYHE